MSATIEKKLKKISDRKSQLQLQEKLLKDKEKKAKQKKLMKVVNILGKAGIENIDEMVLLGAFLEIQEKIESGRSTDSWKAKAEEFLDRSSKASGVDVSIVLEGDPNDVEKAFLKKNKFQWNRFRKEWCGTASLEEIEASFGERAKIERL